MAGRRRSVVSPHRAVLWLSPEVGPFALIVSTVRLIWIGRIVYRAQLLLPVCTYASSPWQRDARRDVFPRQEACRASEEAGPNAARACRKIAKIAKVHCSRTVHLLLHVCLLISCCMMPTCTDRLPTSVDVAATVGRLHLMLKRCKDGQCWL